MTSLCDENLSVKLFKPQRKSLETSFISNSVEELVSFNSKSKNWYRLMPFAYWAWLGIDIIEVMSVISNISSSTNKRTREGVFDTVYEYGSGNWCYEFSQKATEYVAKAQEASENNDSDNAFKYYRFAYLFFAIASYPHLKGDELGEQALIQHYIYYKKAVDFLPGYFEELKIDVEGKTVSAYLHTPNKSEVLPCVVIYSNYHNLSTEYLRYYREYLFPRNIAMLSVDLPAVGLSRAFDLQPDIGFIHNAVIEHVINNCLYINRNKIGLLSQRFGSIAAVHSLIKFNKNVKCACFIGPILHEFFVNKEALERTPSMFRASISNRIGFDTNMWHIVSSQLQVYSVQKRGLLTNLDLDNPILIIGDKNDLLSTSKDIQVAQKISDEHKIKYLDSKMSGLEKFKNVIEMISEFFEKQFYD